MKDAPRPLGVIEVVTVIANSLAVGAVCRFGDDDFGYEIPGVTGYSPRAPSGDQAYGLHNEHWKSKTPEH